MFDCIYDLGDTEEKRGGVMKNSKVSISSILVILGLSIICIVILIPFYYMFINSLSTWVGTGKMSLIPPTVLHFENYSKVWAEGKMLRGFANSLKVTSVTLLVVLVIGSLAGFILGRRKDRISIIMYAYFTIGMTVPAFAIPTIKILQFFGVYNSLFALILIYTAFGMPFSIFVLTRFVKTIPKELDESATIDGCRTIQLFYKIIFPLLKPAIATVSVFIFMSAWNDFYWPLYILNESKNWTLPLSIFGYMTKFTAKWNYVFAVLVIASLPVLIYYFIAQDMIIEGLTSGAVKG